MVSEPLEYIFPDTPRPRQRWPWRLLVCAVLLLVAWLFIPSADVRQVESRVDAVTGSMTWKTVWMLGITDGPRVDASPLEMRLRTSGIAWTPSWRFLHNTHRDVFGNATSFECGSAPPIYSMRGLLGNFADASTDDELREFVRVMQFGTENEQEAAVDAAGEKGLRYLRAPSPGG